MTSHCINVDILLQQFFPMFKTMLITLHQCLYGIVVYSAASMFTECCLWHCINAYTMLFMTLQQCYIHNVVLTLHQCLYNFVYNIASIFIQYCLWYWLCDGVYNISLIFIWYLHSCITVYKSMFTMMHQCLYMYDAVYEVSSKFLSNCLWHCKEKPQ